MTLKPLKHLNHFTTRHASKLLLAGMAAIGWHNWRLWQRDKQIIAEQASPTALPPLEDWADLPLVSVLVAAWNEKAHIEAHISSFLALRYPHKELVLCAGGHDGTYQLAQASRSNDFSRSSWGRETTSVVTTGRETTSVVTTSPHVKLLSQQAGEGKQRALRRSFAHATGQIIFLTDADCLLDNEKL